MDVKKIFFTLITVVGCVVIGALILNKVLPNAAAAISNSIEDMLFNATGLSMDFNGDGHAGSKNSDGKTDTAVTQDRTKVNAGVSGFGENKKE